MGTKCGNRAFEYCPGAHWEVRYRVGYHASHHGCPVVDIPSDLLIFDASGLHRGGLVREGGERRVLRAHTYLTECCYINRLFLSICWANSPLNINRWSKSSTTWVLGDEIQETTSNRYQHDISKTPLDD